MLIEYPDQHERKRELSRLIGVEDRMFVEVEGHARVGCDHTNYPVHVSVVAETLASLAGDLR